MMVGKSTKESYLKTLAEEHARTMKVLNAFPPEKADLKPHAKLRSAKDLAYKFAQEPKFSEMVIQDRLFEAFSLPPEPVPATWDEVLAAIEPAYQSLRKRVEAMSDEELHAGVTWGVAKGQFEKVPVLDFLWLMLHDQIHHRGQFTIYVRLADARLPGVYGPSADEPWN